MSISPEKTDQVKKYLESYLALRGMLFADSYAKDYSDSEPPLCDGIIIRAKMHEIECFVRSLPVCREQNMLFQHYIRGHSVEFCGEMLDVSRRTAFRIVKRALALAAEYYAK